MGQGNVNIDIFEIWEVKTITVIIFLALKLRRFKKDKNVEFENVY